MSNLIRCTLAFALLSCDQAPSPAEVPILLQQQTAFVTNQCIKIFRAADLAVQRVTTSSDICGLADEATWLAASLLQIERMCLAPNATGDSAFSWSTVTPIDGIAWTSRWRRVIKAAIQYLESGALAEGRDFVPPAIEAEPSCNQGRGAK